MVRVGAARDFSAALTASGKLFGWGNGLGYANLTLEDIVPLPIEIESYAEIAHKKHTTIKKFVAIDRFMIVLFANGRLYSVGKNNQGVLGTRKHPLILDDFEVRYPTKMVDKQLNGEKIVDFESSANATIMITETGNVFYTGMFTKFQPTPFPLDVKVSKIFAGESSVGVITEDGKVLYLNEQIVDDSDYFCHRNKVWMSEDDKLKGVVEIGGSYHIRYALVQ